MRGCVRLDHGVCSGWFAVEKGLRQGCVLASSLFNMFFVAFIDVAYARFKADKDIMDTLVHHRKIQGAGGAIAGEITLAMLLWGMHYAEDAGVVSQSPEQLRKMMGVIVVVDAAVSLTESEAETEILYKRTKGIPEAPAIFSVEAAGQVYNQANEFLYLGGNANQNAERSIDVGQRIPNAWFSFWEYTLEVYDQTSAPLELKPRY